MRIYKFLTIALLLAAAGCSGGQGGLRRGKDAYPDFAALKAANTEGLDYSREAYDRGSKVAVFAIHGGDIEAATARVARHVAGKDFNLYIFNGWHGGAGDLHITAAHFDDPEALRIAAASVLGVSIHEQGDRGSWVCVGGSNKAAGMVMASHLQAAGFQAETPCARLPGVTSSNIANRPSAGGVQLEITWRLLERLEQDPAELERFAGAVRAAALGSLN
jgi:phage replication-related protein YjqB (UPF0714/DUF867 family)